mmetsp:Transcript_1378/g.4342  ORF Transcript_1378/g.4342 Transcript_1378/m.4342 type:complete len:290 (-) Transcript_1378:779-1648(-)
MARGARRAALVAMERPRLPKPRQHLRVRRVAARAASSLAVRPRAATVTRGGRRATMQRASSWAAASVRRRAIAVACPQTFGCVRATMAMSAAVTATATLRAVPPRAVASPSVFRLVPTVGSRRRPTRRATNQCSCAATATRTRHAATRGAQACSTAWRRARPAQTPCARKEICRRAAPAAPGTRSMGREGATTTAAATAQSAAPAAPAVRTRPPPPATSPPAAEARAGTLLTERTGATTTRAASARSAPRTAPRARICWRSTSARLLRASRAAAATPSSAGVATTPAAE